MTDAYPNLEFLRLTTWRYESETLPMDDNAALSAFRFPHLTFLSLQNLQLLDGSALLPVRSKVSLIYNASTLNLILLLVV